MHIYTCVYMYICIYTCENINIFFNNYCFFKTKGHRNKFSKLFHISLIYLISLAKKYSRTWGNKMKQNNK